MTLLQYRNDVDVQAECLRVLGNMCSGNDENRRVAGRRGAIQAVVDARRATEETRTSRRKGMAISWLRGFVAVVASKNEQKPKAKVKAAAAQKSTNKENIRPTTTVLYMRVYLLNKNCKSSAVNCESAA